MLLPVKKSIDSVTGKWAALDNLLNNKYLTHDTMCKFLIFGNYRTICSVWIRDWINKQTLCELISTFSKCLSLHLSLIFVFLTVGLQKNDNKMKGMFKSTMTGPYTHYLMTFSWSINSNEISTASYLATLFPIMPFRDISWMVFTTE